MTQLAAEMLWRLTPLAGAAAWCAVTACLPAGLNVCGFHWLTGRPCPLCGTTRALTALASLDWREAVALNALSPLTAALLMALPLLALARRAELRVWQSAAAAFGAYGVLRALSVL